MGKSKRASSGAPSGPAVVASVDLKAGGFVLLVVTEAKVYVTQNQEYVCDLDAFSKFFGEEDTLALLRAYEACSQAFSCINSSSSLPDRSPN